MQKTGIIIVAGGSGTRAGGDTPKQFIPVAGKEILVRCLEAYLRAVPEADIVVVIPVAYKDLWNQITGRHGLQGTHRVCDGGKSRPDSVHNGMMVLGPCDIIAVHDGARPFLSEDLILRTLDEARRYGSAIPVIEPVDSFRRIVNNTTEIIDRRELRAIQTPQVFNADILRNAYAAAEKSREGFTDDASVVEAYGADLFFCPGERLNIKITTADDIRLADLIAQTF